MRKSFVGGSAAGLLLLGLSMLATLSTSARAAQQIAVPSYIYPGAAWSQIEGGAPAVRIAIVNPASGPGDTADPNYKRQIAETRSHGIQVIGYVDTAYAKRDIAAVERDMSTYETWYGVDGFLFDEASSSADKIPYYATLHDYVLKLNPKAITVLNPGNETDEGYLKVANIILTFEGSYADYVAKYQAPNWVTRYPSSRFWHVVYDAHSAADMENAVALSKARHAGWVYVTPLGLPDPYDKMPDVDYWSTEVHDASAGK